MTEEFRIVAGRRKPGREVFLNMQGRRERRRNIPTNIPTRPPALKKGAI